MISFTSEMISYQFTCEWYDLYFHCGELRLFLTILGLISFRKGFKCSVLVKTLRLEHKQVKLKQTSYSNIWPHLLGLRCATLHATSSWRQRQAAFLNRPFFFIHILSHFLEANYVYTNIIFIKHAELKNRDEKWLGRSYYWTGLLSVIVLKSSL